MIVPLDPERFPISTYPWILPGTQVVWRIAAGDAIAVGIAASVTTTGGIDVIEGSVHSLLRIEEENLPHVPWGWARWESAADIEAFRAAVALTS